MQQSLQENFSVIIPTFCEANNIEELIMRFANIKFNVHHFEVIIVDDDSCDGIIDVVHRLKDEFPWLKLIVRQGEKSLSKAVIEGFRVALYPILIVMDADLSHPPEKIPEMLKTLANPKVDMVIGSRYIAGGSTDVVWPMTRKIASRSAALLARLVIGRNIKDPLSGFIAIRKDKIVNGSPLLPIGWKISLEMMIKCRCKLIKEIPIHFAERNQGNSKMNFLVLIQYLLHIKRLAFYKLFSAKE